MSKTERTLVRWGLILVGAEGPILAGEEPGGAEYRTSTPLVELDIEAGTAVTASGRPYRLLGPADPGYALRALHGLWRTGSAEIILLTPAEALPFVDLNRPFDRTPEEQAAVDEWKLPEVAGQTALLMLNRGLSNERAAEIAGISLERLEDLINGSREGWTVTEAEEVFDRLAARL